MPHPSISAQTHPDKPAIIMANSGDIVTYRQLDERSNQGAHLFRSLGLQAGAHIGMMLENNRQFLEICWAAQRSGLTFTPISTHLKKDEAAYILENCKASLFIGSLALSEVAEQLAQDRSKIKHFLMVNGTRPGFDSWDKLINTMPTTAIADQRHGTPMLYSSGTTGKPKGIFLPPPSEDINAPSKLVEKAADAFGFTENTRYLSPAPLYHAAPLHYNLMTLYQGGTSVIMEKFDPEKALQLIEQHKITHSQWVPIMFIRMLKLPAEVRNRYDISSMLFAVHAAAPCPVEVKQQMIDWWGEVIMEYYSSSESVGLTFIDSASWLTHQGSVGQAMDCTLHILDDDGNELPSGETGLVYFEDPKAIKFEYFNAPGKNAEVYNDKGWVGVGDIGFVDEEGFLYLSDRKNFMIISGGVNIYPQEIENALALHPRVADVAVFGIPNEEFGEEVKAVIQPEHWRDANNEVAQEILTWLRQRISNVKMPRSLDFQEKLPRMENGKLYKRLLAEEYKAG
ncbi:Long-chain-fatty-acid--CoA ligase FadD13 [Zhongshania aliphaticivorans]|uniref:Long-chain-fatty-acid--CoA ligase FadD13 n=1 Tax=Zhongshania aliphaticivorans TaxID=1470434 RepID=A0A5S9N4C4_9GAMM|nr:acyl-CoA synthetase [Zhongshania aliphaticivorans]CAA0081838.1 Long-chain-fatty-acid--CoA ligase FadD13 [Zhongshania aliphaticivorans]CAA0084629.1 Long-chain-fatty-acid--CoA ligase FadD13 [Zhongshania aliphaticivorans]